MSIYTYVQIGTRRFMSGRKLKGETLKFLCFTSQCFYRELKYRVSSSQVPLFKNVYIPETFTDYALNL